MRTSIRRLTSRVANVAAYCLLGGFLVGFLSSGSCHYSSCSHDHHFDDHGHDCHGHHHHSTASSGSEPHAPTPGSGTTRWISGQGADAEGGSEEGPSAPPSEQATWSGPLGAPAFRLTHFTLIPPVIPAGPGPDSGVLRLIDIRGIALFELGSSGFSSQQDLEAFTAALLAANPDLIGDESEQLRFHGIRYSDTTIEVIWVIEPEPSIAAAVRFVFDRFGNLDFIEDTTATAIWNE